MWRETISPDVINNGSLDASRFMLGNRVWNDENSITRTRRGKRPREMEPYRVFHTREFSYTSILISTISQQQQKLNYVFFLRVNVVNTDHAGS